MIEKFAPARRVVCDEGNAGEAILIHRDVRDVNAVLPQALQAQLPEGIAPHTRDQPAAHPEPGCLIRKDSGRSAGIRPQKAARPREGLTLLLRHHFHQNFPDAQQFRHADPPLSAW